MSAVLSAVGIQKSFGLTPALRDASVRVGAGEVVAVMGPSGSGKSTLLHCLAAVMRPDAGEVWYAGERIDRLSERRRSALRRDEFGFVYQFGQLVPELTVLDNVMLPLLLSGGRRRQAAPAALDLLQQLDLVGLQDRRPGELSGGQAQRVAVARALIRSPRVIFADEPTGALDSLAGEKVMDLLLDCARERGSSVVLVTHEPRVAACADREVVVRDGSTS
jgi:putative ABC transport system ATP-binding protein